ncbi:SusC/RagA family TonB-linked outer membrane protein [Gillisia sp. M10.2A]|uniref:SusC/RagA family TonB-linked outer membrane protein n=1 Tax=Gillisia lutea TaxID=2909668 RepID=A0ABS9EET6_9FLAO|nr:SusC/RagA family TonB-linked outer membrane protein [Gillisia lutea]MCF4100777.1 SusC/RagA family TonB-linked outer membrane protein [Gillisia lutea]
MRLTLLFAFITLFTLHANSAYSQKTNVTLNLENVSIERLIDEIETKTDFRFVFKTKDVDLNRRISIKVQKKPVTLILNEVFGQSRTSYNIIDQQIFLTEKSGKGEGANSSDQKVFQLDQSQIKGLVTDENGNSFPGVYVIIKNTSSGVISDLNGNFSITAGPKDILLFSHIGYRTQEVTLQGPDFINIKMETDMAELSEVILTGIYQRKAESFTGSTISVTGEELKRVGNSNLFQAIQNIDPSIVIMDNFSTGSNPNALPDMQIRGTSTFPAQETDLGSELKGNFLKDPNQPLFILNGFEVSIEQVYDLNINRIEMITVLKDAASKALYGSKAANGVVVIETKQLSSDEALITYNSSLDLEFPDLSSYNLTNSMEKLDAEVIDGMYVPSLNDSDNYVELQQLYNSRRKLALEGLDTDWMAKPLQNGIGQRHAFSVELGSNDLRMQANLSYRDIQGIMKGSGRENIAGGITAFYRVKNLSFRNIINVNSNKTTDSPYGEFSEYAVMNPYWRAENLDGSIPYYAEIGPNNVRYTNPLYNSTLNSRIESSYFNFSNNFYLEWNILSNLKAVTRVGIDVKKSDGDEFYSSKHTKFENYLTQSDIQRKGSYQINNGESTYLSGDFNLQYSKNRNKSFYFANVGFNISERKFEEIVHKAEGFPSSRMDDIIFARDYALDSRPTGINGITRDIGFLAVGSYVYDNRFLSDFTLRTSASSQFGADKRWANFWSLGLGWNLHNEKFFRSSFLEQLKVRGSIGSTGNQNFNTNESIATYAYYLNSRYQGFPGSYVLNISNPSLQWESKFDYNAGLDAKIGHLSLRFDYYESYTENLITDITIPYSTGFDRVKDNLGKVKNSGIEANISYLLWSKGRDFVSINGGVSTNKNEIVELSNAMKSYNEAMDEQAADRGNSEPVHKYEDGMSMNAIWAVRSLGIDPSTGNEIYLDRNGNTTYEWSAEDLAVVGNSNPKYRGIFGISGEYKGFGVNVTGRYLGGGQLYNQTLVDKVENVDMNYNVDRRVLTGRWLYPGQDALFKRLGKFTVDTDGDNVVESYQEKTRATSRFVQDRNELDIAAVNVYYEFQKQVIDALKLKRLRLSFNMNEVAKFSSIEIERGTLYPFSRSMSFSLTANF